jgi:signal transduction histidine kinase
VTQPSKVLVVDDEEAGRFVKTQILRRAGFTTMEAATGNDALALAASEGPDLVVLDVNLPDISGLEVCRRLRAAESAPPALQILQISHTAVTPSDRVRGLEHGADVYLAEPVDGAVLVATVHALLRVRRAEAALAAALDSERRARQMAEQASLLKDEFIATLSHELRTPLNALMGWIWQLRHTSLPEDARTRALDSLERNARMQAQLINDLLDVSRASKGKLQLEMRLLDLKSVVLAATEFVREAVEQKQLVLDQNLTSVSVAADQGRLQQVVTNLLTNAVQFTPRNGRISLTLKADGDAAVLTVQDTGAGIEPSLLPHVFDQFRQGEGVMSRKHGGLGLGLAVVKQLTDLHDGTVTVTSPGRGSGATFTVRLPRETNVPCAGEPSGALLLRDVRILLVSRDAAPDTLKGVLESSGARVVVSGSATGQATATGDVDLVVTDPGSDSPLTIQSASEAPVAIQSIERSTQPSAIVRRIAHLIAVSKTPQAS